MRDQTTSNREAERPAPTAVGSGDLLGISVNLQTNINQKRKTKNMAWNPEPRVADCRDIARKWGGKKQVIIIALDEKGRMDMATYGETKQLCTVAKKLGEVGLDAINNFIALVDAAIDA